MRKTQNSMRKREKFTMIIAVVDSLSHRFSSSKWPMTKHRQRTATKTEIRTTWAWSPAMFIANPEADIVQICISRWINQRWRPKERGNRVQCIVDCTGGCRCMRWITRVSMWDSCGPWDRQAKTLRFEAKDRSSTLIWLYFQYNNLINGFKFVQPNMF